MAKRASTTFHIALPDGTRTFEKDSVVPAAIAKKVGQNVYDDGAKTKPTTEDG